MKFEPEEQNSSREKSAPDGSYTDNSPQATTLNMEN
jgi:hypothetical protein